MAIAVMCALLALWATSCLGMNRLAFTNWVFEGYGPASEPEPAGAKKPITLEFRFGDLMGDSGCNTYVGSYVALGGWINTADSLGGTLAGCGRSLSGDLPAGPEEIYRRALTSSRGYMVLGDRLILWYRGGQMVFRRAGT